MDMKLKLLCFSLVVIVVFPMLSVATTSAGTTDRGVRHATTTIKGNSPCVSGVLVLWSGRVQRL